MNTTIAFVIFLVSSFCFAKEFQQIDGWYKGKDVKYYDFGGNSPSDGTTVSTANLYVLITGFNADGTPQSVPGLNLNLCVNISKDKKTFLQLILEH